MVYYATYYGQVAGPLSGSGNRSAMLTAMQDAPYRGTLAAGGANEAARIYMFDHVVATAAMCCKRLTSDIYLTHCDSPMSWCMQLSATFGVAFALTY